MAKGGVAGLAYFAIIFGVGFALGVVRVLVLIPGLGATVSVLIELPIILSTAWVVCRWLVRRLAVPATWSSRLAMGSIAFVLLMLAEAALSIAVFENTLAAHFENYASTAGVVGLAGQILFATFPLVRLFIDRSTR